MSLLLAANWQALRAWVTLWAVSGHEYGFVILAICIWMIFRERSRILELTPRPAPWGLIALFVLGVASCAAYLVDVRLGQLVILLASICGLVGTVLGPSVLRVVAYPLAFLWLALPVWNIARPVLQEMTVNATALAFRAIGMPVFVDETYIHVPEGAVLVLAECSGVQYFQAGVTLGALYAYLNFRSMWLRVVTIAGFAILSILGNWIRVDALILLDSPDGLRHFGVGWAIFGLLIFPAMLFGTRLERFDTPAHTPDGRREPSRAVANPPGLARRAPASTIALAAASACMLAAGPVIANRLDASSPDAVSPDLRPFTSRPPWSGPYPPTATWRPSFENATSEIMASYTAADGRVDFYSAYYARQRQDAEVINSMNVVYDPSEWRLRGGNAGTEYRRVEIEAGAVIDVIETRLEHRELETELLVWHWFRVAGHPTVRPWRAKLAQLQGLLEGRLDAAAIVIGTDSRDLEAARSLLRQFTAANIESIRFAMDRAGVAIEEAAESGL